MEMLGIISELRKMACIIHPHPNPERHPMRVKTLKVAERYEAELDKEQWSFITVCPRAWGKLPIPDGPITVSIDGGYGRDLETKKHHFEVIVGKSYTRVQT
jgi:hypothetical protein